MCKREREKEGDLSLSLYNGNYPNLESALDLLEG